MRERESEGGGGAEPVRCSPSRAPAVRRMPRGVLLALALLVCGGPARAQVAGLSGIRFESPIPVPVYILERTIPIDEALPGYPEPSYVFRNDGGSATLRVLDLYRSLGSTPVYVDLPPGQFTFQFVIPGWDVTTLQLDTREPGSENQTWEIRPGREGLNFLGLAVSVTGGMVWWSSVGLAAREWFVKREFGTASIVWASSHALLFGGMAIAFGPGSPKIRRTDP